MPGEHATQDFKNQAGIFRVELDGLVQCCGQRHLLYLERRLLRFEADLIAFRAVTLIRHHRLNRQMQGLSATLNDQICRLATLILQIPGKSYDRMQLQAIDAEDLVARLQPGLLGGHTAFDKFNRYRRRLHFRDEAECFQVEIIRVARIADIQRQGNALAIAFDGHRHGLAQVQGGTDGNLFPGRILHGFEMGNAVIGAETGLHGGRVRRHIIDVTGLRTKGLNLVVHHVKTGHEEQREQEVRDRSGQRNQDPLPARLGIQVSGIRGPLPTGLSISARHVID